MTVSLILVFGCLSLTEVSVKVVNAERAHQDVCLFVCSERSAWRLWMQRSHQDVCLFVCLFREVSIEDVDAERAHQDVCLFVCSERSA